MLRRSNYHDTLAEFFPVTEAWTDKEKSSSERGKTPPTIFLNIEMFYNNKRRHGSCEQMSTIEYKNNYYQQLGRSKTTRGDSILDHWWRYKWLTFYRLLTIRLSSIHENFFIPAIWDVKTKNLTPKMTMLLQFGLLTLVYSSPNAKMRERGTLLSTPLFLVTKTSVKLTIH